MQNAIILHGTCDKDEYFSDKYPSLSNSHWLPWLQKQLLVRGVLAQTPEIPDAYEPVYEKWQKVFEQFKVNEETTLIGYSCGGGFLVRWLSENKVSVDKLILVAPWMDPKREWTDTFFDFTIDSFVQERIEKIYVLISQDESVPGVKKSVQMITESWPQAEKKVFEGMGHFTHSDMGTHKFLKLRELALGKV